MNTATGPLVPCAVQVVGGVKKFRKFVEPVAAACVDTQANPKRLSLAD